MAAIDLLQAPKIELHLHLDCCLSFEAVSQLQPGITREAYDRDFLLPENCNGLTEFLRRVPRSLALLQTEAGLQVAVQDLFAQLERDGVIYAEIRFAPLQHLTAGLTPEAVVEITAAELASLSAASNIRARLILCTLRHFSKAQSMQTVKLVERFRDRGVVALDLAADEAGFPLDAHRSAFQYALERGIHRTAHAGEARGPRSVWETLQHLQPTRIGHGVRSIEDPTLMAHLKTRRIHLEICPFCNLQIGIFPAYSAHPVDRLHRAGLSVGINTDGRTLPHTTLSQEYQRLQQVFGWGREEFLACNLNALRAAFLHEPEKAFLEKRLREFYMTGHGTRRKM